MAVSYTHLDPTLRGDYRRSQSEAVNWGIDLTGSWNKQLEDHYLTANCLLYTSYNYWAMFAHSFGEGSTTQNEQGYYIGMELSLIHI